MDNKSWLHDFPAMEREDLVALRKYLDSAYREFSRNYGDLIETLFDPLLVFLVNFEKLLLQMPWPMVLAIIIIITFWAARSFKLTACVFVSFVLIGYFGMWDNTMRTLAITLVASCVAIVT